MQTAGEEGTTPTNTHDPPSNQCLAQTTKYGARHLNTKDENPAADVTSLHEQKMMFSMSVVDEIQRYSHTKSSNNKLTQQLYQTAILVLSLLMVSLKRDTDLASVSFHCLGFVFCSGMTFQ